VVVCASPELTPKRGTALRVRATGPTLGS
jgi:hypothetical protein